MHRCHRDRRAIPIAVCGAIVGLLSVIPYFFYDLRGEKLEMIRTEMKIRREELSKSVSGGDGVEE